ncbi:unnamed protein product [Miscanthus lutarioriparius]|uniref:CRC domain-containing protein n=1 Tax=Miscanthus lutarioriparius TaxID=422564 RepID=A0A811RAN0_9POAL|nr:unnamed protein product [Miscanthus lutarioriparius]
MDTPDRPRAAAAGFEDSPVFNFINNLSPIPPPKPLDTAHNVQLFKSSDLAPVSSIFDSPHALPQHLRGMRRRSEKAGVSNKGVDKASDHHPVNSTTPKCKTISGDNSKPLRTPPRALPGIGLHLNALAAIPKEKIDIQSTINELSNLIGPSGSSPAPSEQININDDFNQTTDVATAEASSQGSPKKKRQKFDNGDGTSCKRCSCKKSKCLKLYCECFAAGVYCSEPCSCIGCLNNQSHTETVLSTRQQIESRNPLAFAPKVIHTSEPGLELGDFSNKTPASARHKRGCNCKKSSCLKKYCECFQGGVGCSISCRCEGCKNAFGKREGAAVLGIEEPKQGLEEKNVCVKEEKSEIDKQLVIYQTTDAAPAENVLTTPSMVECSRRPGPGRNGTKPDPRRKQPITAVPAASANLKAPLTPIPFHPLAFLPSCPPSPLPTAPRTPSRARLRFVATASPTTPPEPPIGAPPAAAAAAAPDPMEAEVGAPNLPLPEPAGSEPDDARLSPPPPAPAPAPPPPPPPPPPPAPVLPPTPAAEAAAPTASAAVSPPAPAPAPAPAEANGNSDRKRRRKAEDGDGCKTCSCKKSRCMKLYCVCFASGSHCTESCGCEPCENKQPLQVAPRTAPVLPLKPVQTSEAGQDIVEQVIRSPMDLIRRKCTCKKSGCLKKYCDCYQEGQDAPSTVNAMIVETHLGEKGFRQMIKGSSESLSRPALPLFLSVGTEAVLLEGTVWSRDQLRRAWARSGMGVLCGSVTGPGELHRCPCRRGKAQVLMLYVGAAGSSSGGDALCANGAGGARYDFNVQFEPVPDTKIFLILILQLALFWMERNGTEVDSSDDEDDFYISRQLSPIPPSPVSRESSFQQETLVGVEVQTMNGHLYPKPLAQVRPEPSSWQPSRRPVEEPRGEIWRFSRRPSEDGTSDAMEAHAIAPRESKKPEIHGDNRFSIPRCIEVMSAMAELSPVEKSLAPDVFLDASNREIFLSLSVDIRPMWLRLLDATDLLTFSFVQWEFLVPCPDIIHVMWHCAIVKECPDSWNLTLQPCWRAMHQLMFIHAHEVRLPGGKAREEMMCPVSPEQWQQRAVATQTAQTTGTTRGQVCANQALRMQMHVPVPKRQTWEHVSHGRHQAAPSRWGAAVPGCRRRAGLTNQAAE